MVEASLVNLAELGVLVGGVAIALIQLRNLNKTRQIQLFMQIYSRLDDNEFWENYGKLVWEYEFEGIDDYHEKYGPGTKTGGYAAYMSLSAFFRGIGVLIDKELIDIDVVDELVGVITKRVWEKIRPIAEEHRERFDYSREAKWVEYLANRIMEREQNIKNQ